MEGSIMCTKPTNLHPTTNRAPGPQSIHRSKAAMILAAAAASILTAAGNMRPILRRIALAVVGTGAAAAMVLGSGAASFAAVNTTVNTTNQAGYQVGNNAYRFRFVQGEMTLPLTGCADNNNHNNYRNSGVQLIGATGASAAVGAECINVFGPRYFVGWNLGYSGHTFPSLPHLTTAVAAGHQILVKLFYDQSTNFIHFSAVDKTTNTTLLSTAQSAGPALYKQAVLSADVSNPLPSPPPPGTSKILVPFTGGAVTTYNGTHGTGINGPWGVQQEQAVNGTHLVANAPVLSNSGTTFNVRIHG
jgi:hypothetical protein